MYSELVRAIEHGTDILILSTGLLRLCREHLAELQQLDAEPGLWIERDQLRRRCVQFFRAVDDEELDAQEQEELCAIALERSQTLPGVVIAHTIAEALDLVLGTRLLPMFIGRKVTLEPGDAIPLPHPDWRRLMSIPAEAGKDPGPGARLDTTSHLGLAPEWAAKVRVTMDGNWRRWHVLPQLQRGDRLACATPNHSLAELALQQDEVEPALFHVRSDLDTSEQTRWCLALLELARVHGCRVVIFPELSAAEPVRSAMHEWLEAQSVVDVLVAGSCHVPANSGYWCNEARVYIRGLRSPMVHHKFCPLSVPVAAARGKRVLCREHLAPNTPALTAHLSPHWTWVVLLGADAIAEPIPRVLADVHANLVLVPALSFHMDAFYALAEILAAHCHAVSLVANACLAPEPGAARPPLIIGLPSHLGAVISHTPPARSLVIATIASLTHQPSVVACPDTSG